jgi:elongation factor P
MLDTSDFKRGLLIEVDGKPWRIVDVSVNSPSARSGNLIVRTKMKSLLDGTVVEKPFRGGDKVGEPDVERRASQYLYSDDTFAHFMDGETYDQFQIANDDLGDTALYLYDGIEDIRVVLWNGSAISIELPTHVELQIVETTPSIKGATASAQTKPATLSTGLVVQVPAYIASDEVVRVDTRTGAYLNRVK